MMYLFIRDLVKATVLMFALTITALSIPFIALYKYLERKEHDASRR